MERPRRQDHRRVVGAVLRLRRPRPQGDRRRRRRAAPRARFLRAVPARPSEAVRARDAHRRAHARRPQPDLLRQFRLRVRRHGDEGRARLPPGARPGRTQRLRLARTRLPRRQLRRRRAVRASSTTAASTGRGCRASRTCGTRTSRKTSSRRAKARTAPSWPRTCSGSSNLYGAGEHRRLLRRADRRVHRLPRAAEGLPQAPARDLRRARHPARVRRSDHAASAAPARRSPRRASASRRTS